LGISRPFNERYSANSMPNTAHIPSSRCVNCGPGRLQSIYSSAYLGFNIQLYVSALLLVISRQRDARYTTNFGPNIAHILPLTLCELWSRSYTMHLQLRIFRLQYSAVGICAAIPYISTMLRALTANLEPNAAHILQFTLCELWSRSYTM
jgi:hypothetical protein